jgi:hypothetical protein
MKVVVVGGHSRNIGKTSVMAGVIRGLESLAWTAVKITQYGHGICSVDGEPCECDPKEHAFVLSEESDRYGRADTCRFLAAGARRSLWLRVRQGQMSLALPSLLEAINTYRNIIIESNSILEFLKPAAYIVVLDRSRRDFKASARQFLDRADALVSVGAGLEARAWPDLNPQAFGNKPVFRVSIQDASNPDLCRFIRAKLDSLAETPFAD